MFSRTSRLNQKPVVLRIFRVLHTVQFSRFVVVCSQQQLVYLITTRCVCQQLFLFSFWKPSKTLSDFLRTSVPLSATRYILSQVLIPVKLIFQFFPFFSFPVIPSIFTAWFHLCLCQKRIHLYIF